VARAPVAPVEPGASQYLEEYADTDFLDPMFTSSLRELSFQPMPMFPSVVMEHTIFSYWLKKEASELKYAS